MTTTLKRLELYILLTLAALAVFVVWEAARMPSGTLSLPGPGMLPLALGTLLAMSSLALILLSRRADPEAEGPIILGNRQVVISFLVLLGAGLLFERAGFIVASTLFLFLQLLMLSPLGWWRAMSAAVVTTFALHYVFQGLLGVQLPPLPWAY